MIVKAAQLYVTESLSYLAQTTSRNGLRPGRLAPARGERTNNDYKNNGTDNRPDDGERFSANLKMKEFGQPELATDPGADIRSDKTHYDGYDTATTVKTGNSLPDRPADTSNEK